MATIDLLGLEPKKISKDLKGKYILLYSQPKWGKTTFAASAPKSLIFSFEPGCNALSNVYSQNIQTWIEFKTAVKQLSNPKVQEKFDFVALDTADISFELCEAYICAQNGVEKIGDIPWGGGYSALAKEFSKVLRSIAMLGYGMVFISHSTEKILKDEKGVEYTQIQPACPTRARDIINKLVDFIIYGDTVYTKDEPEGHRVMRLRGKKDILAGSRFRYVPSEIEFGYTNLVEAVSEAIDKQVGERVNLLTEEKDTFYKNDNRPFEEAMEEAKTLWISMNDSDETVAKMNKIVENNFGRKIKLSSVEESQQEILEATIVDLKELSKTL